MFKMNEKTNIIFESHAQIRLKEDLETVNECMNVTSVNCYKLRPKIDLK